MFLYLYSRLPFAHNANSFRRIAGDGVRKNGKIPAAGYRRPGATAAKTFSSGLPGVFTAPLLNPELIVGLYVIGPLPVIYCPLTTLLIQCTVAYQHAMYTGE